MCNPVDPELSRYVSEGGDDTIGKARLLESITDTNSEWSDYTHGAVPEGDVDSYVLSAKDRA